MVGKIEYQTEETKDENIENKMGGNIESGMTN